MIAAQIEFIPTMLQGPGYNCNAVLPVGQAWADRLGKKQIPFGIYSLVFGVITEILYIPCMIGLGRDLRCSCIKIMFWLSFVDMIAILANCFAFGFLLLEVLAEKWPTLDVSDANCYDRFRFICFAVVSIVGLVTCSVCSGIICFHTFARLRVTSSLSETAKRNNFSMTTALLVQASFPFVLMVFPLTYSLIAVLINASGPLSYSLCYMSISIHSPVHSIILLSVTPIYRKKVAEILCKNKNSKISTVREDHTHTE